MCEKKRNRIIIKYREDKKIRLTASVTKVIHDDEYSHRRRCRSSTIYGLFL